MAARLGELDRMKEQVYSHLSHELRTPLTSIREATHLLADRVAGPLEPRQVRLVTIIADSTERLLRLVNRILDVSRLRAGLQPIDRRPVRLGTVTARALRELRAQADAAGVVLEHTGNGADPTVIGDEERLVEVVMNLVSNAIKASQAGGTVRVGIDADGSRAALVVADEGVGIPREVLAQIFDPYVQAPGAPAGTGLGLAIVKSIVEAHGGDVAVESEVGRGSRFTVRLRDAASREPTPDAAGRRRRSEHGRAALLALLALLSACSPGWMGPAPFAKGNRGAAAALADADRSALAGRPREATAKYEVIVRDYPSDPAAPEAMHRLVMLRLEPGSSVRDKRAALALLRRLASDYPGTLAGREANAWRGLLRQLDRCEVEATRRGADAEKLRQTLESIKDSDLELEQHQ
jgi:two-component sensor histidine kinase